MERNFGLLVYLAAANLLCLILMLADMLEAKSHRERIPEAALFLSALLGGAVGGTVGMFLFRHKTKHAAFRLGFPLLALAEAALVFWYMGGFKR